MSGIRKQAIISSALVYTGVLFGAVNTYFFVKEGSFTGEQYGLTRLFNDAGQNFFVLASLGVIPVIYKFYPYYKDNLQDNENDLLGRAFLKAVLGFVLVSLAAIFFEPLVIRKFGARSAIFIDYYFWVLPFSFGILAFSLLEGYAWAIQKTVASNFLKETLIRVLTTVFILLYYFGQISFSVFMALFSSLYLIIAIVLAIYLIKAGKLRFRFKRSRVTQKFSRKIVQMQLLIFGGIIVTTVGQTIDGMIISSLLGLAPNAVYSLALYTSNLIQIPQRSIQSVSVGPLVRLWKEKDFGEISRIYKRSSINMLLVSLFIFGNVWLNVEDGLNVLNIQAEYAAGLPLLLILGIIRIIDAGTGINAQVIGASNYWRFEFLSGVIMLALRIPLSYLFIKQFGIVGSAYGDLISLTVYNFIRFEFLRRRFGMQPFSAQTIYAIISGMAIYFASYLLFRQMHGWLAMVCRSMVFSTLLVWVVFYFHITPDAIQLWDTVKKKMQKTTAG